MLSFQSCLVAPAPFLFLIVLLFCPSGILVPAGLGNHRRLPLPALRLPGGVKGAPPVPPPELLQRIGILVIRARAAQPINRLE